MSIQIDPHSGRVSYLGTGIGKLAAAKRYLRDKFNRGMCEPIVSRPGARFYVTMRSGNRVSLLLGPYVSHMTAIAAVPRARARLRESGGNAFAAIGTASLPGTHSTMFGR